MQIANNLAQAKKFARALEKALKARGVTLSHGIALDIEAELSGYLDWNALSARLAAGGLLSTGGQAPGAAANVQAQSRKKESGSKATSPKAPVISDVNFTDAHAVIFGGHCFNVEWREEDALAHVGTQRPEGSEAWGTEVALRLHREEDGLVWEETLTVGELNMLTWDAKARCFRNPDGDTFEFYMSRSFADSLGTSISNPAPVQAAALEPANVGPSVERQALTTESYQLYRVEFLEGADMRVTGVSKLLVAQGPGAARAQALTEGIIQESSSNFKIVEMDADLFSPYLVEVNGGYYNEFASLNKAITVAKNLLDADDDIDETYVVTKIGTALCKFEAQP